MGQLHAKHTQTDINYAKKLNFDIQSDDSFVCKWKNVTVIKKVYGKTREGGAVSLRRLRQNYCSARYGCKFTPEQ